MTPIKPSYVASSGCALLLVASCQGGGQGRQETRAATTETTGARMLMNDDAAMRITNTRCQREAACNNVGEGHPFASLDACRQELFHEADTAVRAEACPLGVSERGLALCLSDIQSTQCATPSPIPREPASCRQAQLCAAQ